MATSTQLTNMFNQQPNPMEAMFKTWIRTRYLVAQLPAADDYDETIPGYFNGRVVIPGPKANPKLSDMLGFKALKMHDFQAMMHRHHIRFIDNRTTDNADASVRRALYTVMTNEEADSYERKLKKYYADRRKRISSQTT